jgi:hypothetical protein
MRQAGALLLLLLLAACAAREGAVAGPYVGGGAGLSFSSRVAW